VSTEGPRRCYLCPERRPAHEGYRDSLGELRLGVPEELPVCADCNAYLQAEPFDHKEWS
jgi:hypothetical protein